MQTLKIHIHQTGKIDPDTRITVPLTALHISEKLLPKKVKASLDREGIDLNELTTLIAKQGPKGTLIEIENQSEKMIIIVE